MCFKPAPTLILVLIFPGLLLKFSSKLYHAIGTVCNMATFVNISTYFLDSNVVYLLSFW